MTTMPIQNKIYYKFELVKAYKEHVCHLSGEVIKKDEYYVHLRVDAGTPRIGNHNTLYTPTSTFRFSRQTFASNNVSVILASTKLFGLDTGKTIAELENTINILKRTINALTKE